MTVQTSAAERIVSAALGLIADRGLGGVRMTAVAEAAGVARQTLYNHFPNVDSIIGAVIESHQAASLQQLQAVLATVDSPTGRLEHLVRHAAAVAAEGHPSVAALYGLSAQVRQTLDAHRQDMKELVATTLRDGVERGEFRPDLDPTGDAVLLQRMLDGVGELGAGSPEDVAAVVSTATRTVIAAVALRGNEQTHPTMD